MSRENLWLIIPIIVIIPFLITTVVIHEKNEKEIIEIAIEREIVESEFKVREISANVESTYELFESKLDFVTALTIENDEITLQDKQRIFETFQELNQITPINVIFANSELVVYDYLGNEKYTKGWFLEIYKVSKTQ